MDILFAIETNEKGEVLLTYNSEYGFYAFAETNVIGEKVWINLLKAAEVNFHTEISNEEYGMLARNQGKEFLKADKYLREKSRLKRENDFYESFGDGVYKEMMEFVEEALNDNCTEDFASKSSIGYNRFEHVKRVLNWAVRLYEASEYKDELDYNAILISTIFHDVGRKIADREHISHAKAGEDITRQYLLDRGFDKKRVEYISFLVGAHSDKHLMGNADIDKNLLLLMEADLLDDTGALSIMMDCMISQASPDETGYLGSFDHIAQYTLRLSEENPMVTAEARKIWNDKRKLVCDFYDSLERDLIYTITM